VKSRITITSRGSFKTHKTYSPEEILAAGGATAFGRKSDKNSRNLIKALKTAPTPEPFTEVEWGKTLQQLSTDK
jgi:hypothetical protein